MVLRRDRVVNIQKYEQTLFGRSDCCTHRTKTTFLGIFDMCS